MAQEWVTPVTPNPANSTVPTDAPVQPLAAFELRPLSLGEILDRAFTIYRARFWLFAGIASVAAALQTAVSGLQMLMMNIGKMDQKDPAAMAALGFGFTGGVIVLMILFVAVFCMTQATTVYALSEVYLGHPVTIFEALRKTIGKWYRYIGIGVWQFFSATWIPIVTLIVLAIIAALKLPGGGFVIFLLVLIMLGGAVWGAIQFLRNSLAIPATVVEGLGVVASIRRSKMLASDTKGRIFVVFLLAMALKWAGGLLQAPLLMLSLFRSTNGHSSWWTQASALIVIYVVDGVVEPILMLGLSLVYFDQRVRKEALDLVMMMSTTPPPPPVIFGDFAAQETPVVVASGFAQSQAPEDIVAAEPLPVVEVPSVIEAPSAFEAPSEPHEAEHPEPHGQDQADDDPLA